VCVSVCMCVCVCVCVIPTWFHAPYDPVPCNCSQHTPVPMFVYVCARVESLCAYACACIWCLCVNMCAFWHRTRTTWWYKLAQFWKLNRASPHLTPTPVPLEVTLTHVAVCVAVCGSVLQCVAVCCSAMQCVAVWREHHYIWHLIHCLFNRHRPLCCSDDCSDDCSVLQCVAVCCHVVQSEERITTLGRLQWVAVWCSLKRGSPHLTPTTKAPQTVTCQSGRHTHTNKHDA